MRKFTVVPGVAAALLALGAPAASAEGPNWDTFDVQCQGETLTISTNNGAGDFTPGFLVDSTDVLIPVAFAGSVTIVLPGGTTSVETWPADQKGGGNVESRSPRPMQVCTFSETFTLAEGQDGLPAGTVITFSGSATVMRTGEPGA